MSLYIYTHRRLLGKVQFFRYHQMESWHFKKKKKKRLHDYGQINRSRWGLTMQRLYQKSEKWRFQINLLID